MARPPPIPRPRSPGNSPSVDALNRVFRQRAAAGFDFLGYATNRADVSVEPESPTVVPPAPPAAVARPTAGYAGAPSDQGEDPNLTGEALLAAGDSEGALACFDAVVATAPGRPLAQANRGRALLNLGRAEDARQAFEAALAIKPDMASALAGLGDIGCAEGRRAEAFDLYERALVSNPDSFSAHYGRARMLLASGRFGQGWKDYLWRPSVRDQAVFRGTLPADLRGQHLFIHHDGGPGEELLFLRFLPALRQRGGRICYKASTALAPLIERLGVADEVVTQDREIAAGQMNLMLDLSLGDVPALLGCDDDDIPPPLAVAPNTAPAADFDGTTCIVTGDRPAPWQSTVAAALGGRDGVAIVGAGNLGALWSAAHGAAAFVCGFGAGAEFRAMAGRPAFLMAGIDDHFALMAGGDTSPWYRHATVLRQGSDGDWSDAASALARSVDG